MKIALRKLLALGIAALGCLALLWITGSLVRPNLSKRLVPYTPDQLDAAIQARDVSFDPAHTPTLHVHQEVTPQHEPPILAELVKSGELPPLKDRLPEDPVVMKGADGIGKYGGTWMRLATGLPDVETINFRLAGAYLMRWSPLGYPIEPHIAKSVESSPDARVWTIALRPGLKWSDGVPFTANDIMYWWQCEANNKLVSQPPSYWLFVRGGKPAKFEKLDDYHVRISFDEPYINLPEFLAGIRELCDAPEHYLRKYNPDPKIGDAAFVKQQMAAFKMASPQGLYRYIKETRNPEHPRLWPWIYHTYKPTTPQVFVRNPYYYVVDPAGNQLPYIDRVQFELQEDRVLSVSLANGGASMQDRNTKFTDYTELMSRREISGTRVLHWYPATRSDWVINPNLNRRVLPDRPETKWKAQLLSDKRFRQALSLAIDRQQIIRADYNGLGKPSQVAPGPESPFRSDRLANAFIEHDPARANHLLDDIGVTTRDSEGFRTFPDGTRMTFYLDFTQLTGVRAGQFVVDDWAAVGVRAVLRERTRPLYYAEKDSMDFDFDVWTGESDFMPIISPRYMIPFNGESFFAVGWGRWYQRGGFYGNPKANAAGCIPVPHDSPMYHAIELYEAALRAPNVATQKNLMAQVMDIDAENLWTISICTPPPQLVVVNKDLHNVPANALYGVVFSTPANAGPELYYFDHPHDSPGAIADAKQSINHITPRPGSTSNAKVGAVALTIQWSIGIAIALLVITIGVRHPFVGSRLLIMIPTLIVISICVFTIIQLPPGDILSTQIMQFSESGDPSDLQRVEDFRKIFHFDEPHWKQYMRWMGFYWFGTFQPADEGLLQGSMGRSMQNNQPINEIVGDRLLLTVLISVGTILLTWVLALPIGIYSAVRQYSPGDHALTLIGFIGMCVPAFLLALVLTAVSGVSGLFSPEFAAQPEWNWPKVVDLLRHIWIPIIVLGVGGTASMIRVMRANLLDELKKPYVITAMAKGVRPMKLLLKYPVRLAINPFVSGIGGLFPQLISGGAIVGIVLSLPTLGPTLVQALQTEDMYLAGSMLLLLSLLGIIGTLVSDLLLLWVDPRIRFEGRQPVTELSTAAPEMPPAPPIAESPVTVAVQKEIGAMSQWQLIRLGFARHLLAVWSLRVLVLLYLTAIFAEFLSPASPQQRNLDFQYCPPQLVRWSPSQGLHVRAMKLAVDPVTLRKTYVELKDVAVPLRFFAMGDDYRLWGLIPMHRHLLGIDLNKWNASDAQSLAEPSFYFLGADKYGRDLFTRILFGSRISLSVGLFGIAITFIFGMTIGGISGYIGGRTDTVIQRVIEIFNSFPHLPLWMALGAVMPADWPPVRVYFAITIVLAALGWTGLARVVRGKILSLREEDYAMAARLLGASHRRILFRHLLPGFASHIIVSLSLAVPVMVLGETSLSFLGLGLRPPVVSWGVMLQDCVDVQAVRYYPWLMTPVLFIVATVLCFNFVGDGLRDAADPYAAR